MSGKLIFATNEIKEKGGLACTETLSESELEGDSGVWGEVFGEVNLSAPCRIQIEFSVGGERILLEGKVEGRWDLACSRCLSPHKIDFEGALEETYPLTQERIDVREDVRQAMILSLPERSLCSPACLGLCPQCGKDLNHGPCGCAVERKEVRP